MPKKSRIRWRESDTRELQRTVKNYNAKINRLIKKNPEMSDFLPEKVTMKDARKSIETRADFNRLTKSLQRFSKKGAEKPVSSKRGAKATQWEVDEFKKKQQIENARRTRERKKLEQQEVKSRGKTTGVTRAEMGSIKENSLKPSKKRFDNLSQKEWELAKKNIDNMLNANFRDEKRQKMKDNYIKGLIEAGFPDEVIDLVRGMDLDKFLETVETDQEATFDFIYDPLELQVKSEALKEVWRNASNS